MQFRLLSPFISLFSTFHSGVSLLIPFLVLLYTNNFPEDDWKVWFRVLSTLFYLVSGTMSIYVVVKRQEKRWVGGVRGRQTVGLVLGSVGLVGYTVVLGMAEASRSVNQDDILSAASLDSTCTDSVTVSSWASCLYIIGLCLRLYTDACTISLLLTLSPSSLPDSSTVNLPKSFHDINTYRPNDTHPGPPVIELFKRTNKKGKSTEKESETSFEVVDAPPMFPQSSSATRISRILK